MIKRKKKIILHRLFALIILLVLICGSTLIISRIVSPNKNVDDSNIDSPILDTTIDSNEKDFSNLPDTEIFRKLKSMISQDHRIENILLNYREYPEELLEMLSKNIEMLEFVIDYPEKKGKLYSDNIGEVAKGDIPLLLQWDQRWGYADYGNSSIAVSGCGPTALSMVIDGLTGDNTITPYTVAKFAENNGYYVEGSGSSWSLMTEGAAYFGVTGEEISLSKDTIYSILRSGSPIICSMRPGDFTTTGHFIVLTGIKDGKIQINDPNSKQRSCKLWTYEQIAHQINNLWSFTL